MFDYSTDHDTDDLTLTQLESLVNDYFDCRLSRREEERLRAVLLFSPHHSALIDECRLEMGVEMTLKHACGTAADRMDSHDSIESSDSIYPRKKLWGLKAHWRTWLSVAVAVALFFSIGSYLVADEDSGVEYYAEVYVNGRPVTDHAEATVIALRQQRQCMELMEKLMESSMAEKERCLSNRDRLLDKKARYMDNIRSLGL